MFFRKRPAAPPPMDEERRKLETATLNVVRSIQKALTVSHEESPTDRAIFAGRDLGYYERTASELAAAGFVMLGAFEIAAKRDAPVAERNFGEYALSEDGTIVANWFVVTTPKGAREALVFRSTLLGDRMVVTGRGLTDIGLPYPPGRAPAVLPAATATNDLLDAHRERLVGTYPQRYATIAEVMLSKNDDAARIAAYRRSLGKGLYEAVLTKSYTGDKAPLAQAMLGVIDAHPEWLEV